MRFCRCARANGTERVAAYADSSLIVAASNSQDEFHQAAEHWFTGQSDPVITSVIAEVEVHRALRRQVTAPKLHSQAEHLLRNCIAIEITRKVRRLAATLGPTRLRSLDAIHVATALLAEADEFATFDLRQQIAAEEAGLTVPDLALPSREH